MRRRKGGKEKKTAVAPWPFGRPRPWEDATRARRRPLIALQNKEAKILRSSRYPCSALLGRSFFLLVSGVSPRRFFSLPPQQKKKNYLESPQHVPPRPLPLGDPAVAPEPLHDPKELGQGDAASRDDGLAREEG